MLSGKVQISMVMVLLLESKEHKCCLAKSHISIVTLLMLERKEETVHLLGID